MQSGSLVVCKYVCNIKRSVLFVFSLLIFSADNNLMEIFAIMDLVVVVELKKSWKIYNDFVWKHMKFKRKWKIILSVVVQNECGDSNFSQNDFRNTGSLLFYFITSQILISYKNIKFSRHCILFTQLFMFLVYLCH